MSWVHKTPVDTHECATPRSDGFLGCVVGQYGDLWRCDDCGELWRVGYACDYCDRYGDNPHRGVHAVGVMWRPATWWQRWRNRNKGRSE